MQEHGGDDHDDRSQLGSAGRKDRVSEDKACLRATQVYGAWSPRKVSRCLGEPRFKVEN